MVWCWKTVPSPLPPPFNGIDMIAYAVHPDGRTIFISTGISTHTLDTSNGMWKELGDWVLPFRGQAFFDSGLDALGWASSPIRRMGLLLPSHLPQR